ncbi:uncharacterized protein LOC6584200 isoform X2 [Drosophila mojavensis]|uniref:uncharacterized protein LOC6584200 isoform X2 n=1 Tax=Drosophila mojavensis TaxID=7230 RepID=UPI001CD138FD|nr:uncharacterized protein LOC6584200 isoform X2 [Drosophila mojavensis]
MKEAAQQLNLSDDNIKMMQMQGIKPEAGAIDSNRPEVSYAGAYRPVLQASQEIQSSKSEKTKMAEFMEIENTACINVTKDRHENEAAGSEDGLMMIQQLMVLQQPKEELRNQNKLDQLAVMKYKERNKKRYMEKQERKTKKLLQQIQSKSQNLLGNQLKIESGELNMPPPFIPIDEDNIASIDIDTLQAFKANLEKQLEIIDQSSSDIASPQSTHSNTPVKVVLESKPLTNDYDENVREYPDYMRGSNSQGYEVLCEEKPSLTAENYASKTNTSAENIVSGQIVQDVKPCETEATRQWGSPGSTSQIIEAPQACLDASFDSSDFNLTSIESNLTGPQNSNNFEAGHKQGENSKEPQLSQFEIAKQTRLRNIQKLKSLKMFVGQSENEGIQNYYMTDIIHQDFPYEEETNENRTSFFEKYRFSSMRASSSQQYIKKENQSPGEELESDQVEMTFSQQESSDKQKVKRIEYKWIYDDTKEVNTEKEHQKTDIALKRDKLRIHELKHSDDDDADDDDVADDHDDVDIKPDMQTLSHVQSLSNEGSASAAKEPIEDNPPKAKRSQTQEGDVVKLETSSGCRIPMDNMDRQINRQSVTENMEQYPIKSENSPKSEFQIKQYEDEDEAKKFSEHRYISTTVKPEKVNAKEIANKTKLIEEQQIQRDGNITPNNTDIRETPDKKPRWRIPKKRKAESSTQAEEQQIQPDGNLAPNNDDIRETPDKKPRWRIPKKRKAESSTQAEHEYNAERYERNPNSREAMEMTEHYQKHMKREITNYGDVSDITESQPNRRFHRVPNQYEWTSAEVALQEKMRHMYAYQYAAPKFAPHQYVPQYAADQFVPRYIPQHHVRHRNAAHQYAPRPFAPHQYAPHQYAPHPLAPHQYALHQYAPRQYAPRPFAPHEYAPRPFPPHEYAPHEYAPHQHAPHQYVPHQHAPQYYIPRRPPIPRDQAPTVEGYKDWEPSVAAHQYQGYRDRSYRTRGYEVKQPLVNEQRDLAVERSIKTERYDRRQPSAPVPKYQDGNLEISYKTESHEPRQPSVTEKIEPAGNLERYNKAENHKQRELHNLERSCTRESHENKQIEPGGSVERSYKAESHDNKQRELAGNLERSYKTKSHGAKQRELAGNLEKSCTMESHENKQKEPGGSVERSYKAESHDNKQRELAGNLERSCTMESHGNKQKELAGNLERSCTMESHENKQKELAGNLERSYKTKSHGAKQRELAGNLEKSCTMESHENKQKEPGGSVERSYKTKSHEPKQRELAGNLERSCTMESHENKQKEPGGSVERSYKAESHKNKQREPAGSVERSYKAKSHDNKQRELAGNLEKSCTMESHENKQKEPGGSVERSYKTKSHGAKQRELAGNLERSCTMESHENKQKEPGGSVEKSYMTESHESKKRELAGNLEKSCSMQCHENKQREPAGSVERSYKAESHKNKQREPAGSVERSYKAQNPEPEQRELACNLERSYMTESHENKEREPAGSLERSYKAESPEPKQRELAGNLERSYMTESHESKKRELAGSVERSYMTESHENKEREPAGSVERSYNAESPEPEQRELACNLERSYMTESHENKEREPAGSLERSCTMESHENKQKEPGGSVERSYKAKSHDNKQRELADNLERSYKTKSHGAKQRELAGNLERSCTMESHENKQKEPGGSVEKSYMTESHESKKRELAGNLEKSCTMQCHENKEREPAGSVERSYEAESHENKQREPAGSVERSYKAESPEPEQRELACNLERSYMTESHENKEREPAGSVERSYMTESHENKEREPAGSVERSYMTESHENKEREPAGSVERSYNEESPEPKQRELAGNLERSYMTESHENKEREPAGSVERSYNAESPEPEQRELACNLERSYMTESHENKEREPAGSLERSYMTEGHESKKRELAGNLEKSCTTECHENKERDPAGSVERFYKAESHENKQRDPAGSVEKSYKAESPEPKQRELAGNLERSYMMESHENKQRELAGSGERSFKGSCLPKASVESNPTLKEQYVLKNSQLTAHPLPKQPESKVDKNCEAQNKNNMESTLSEKQGTHEILPLQAAVQQTRVGDIKIAELESTARKVTLSSDNMNIPESSAKEKVEQIQKVKKLHVPSSRFWRFISTRTDNRKQNNNVQVENRTLDSLKTAQQETTQPENLSQATKENITPSFKIGQLESKLDSQNTARGEVEKDLKRKITTENSEIYSIEILELPPYKKSKLAPNNLQQTSVKPLANTKRLQKKGENITQKQFFPEFNVNQISALIDKRPLCEKVAPTPENVLENRIKQIEEPRQNKDLYGAARRELCAASNTNPFIKPCEGNVADKACPKKPAKYLITMTKDGDIEIRYNREANSIPNGSSDVLLTTADTTDLPNPISPESPLDQFWALLEGKGEVDTSHPDENPFEKFWPYLDHNYDMDVSRRKTIFKWDEKTIEAFRRYMDAACKPPSFMIRATIHQINAFFSALAFLDTDIERHREKDQHSRQTQPGNQQNMGGITTDSDLHETPYNLLKSCLNSGNDRSPADQRKIEAKLGWDDSSRDSLLSFLSAVEPSNNESACGQPKKKPMLKANASNVRKRFSINQSKPEPYEVGPKISKLSLNPPKPSSHIVPNRPLTAASLNQTQPSRAVQADGRLPIDNKFVAKNELSMPQKPMPKAQQNPLAQITPMKAKHPYDMPEI